MVGFFLETKDNFGMRRREREREKLGEMGIWKAAVKSDVM